MSMLGGSAATVVLASAAAEGQYTWVGRPSKVEDKELTASVKHGPEIPKRPPAQKWSWEDTHWSAEDTRLALGGSEEFWGAMEDTRCVWGGVGGRWDGFPKEFTGSS